MWVIGALGTGRLWRGWFRDWVEVGGREQREERGTREKLKGPVG